MKYSLQSSTISYSSVKAPCPVCGRTKDGDCRATGNLVFCHTHQTGNPGEVITGSDGQQWAFTKTRDIWGIYTLHQDSQPRRLQVVKAPRPAGSRSWVYEDLEGWVVRVTRTDDGQGNKEIRQYRWDGSRWVAGGITQVADRIHLYRIADARKLAERQKRPILLVEGEPCVESLLKLGIPATTSIGGAGKWRGYGYPNYLDDLAGLSVVLCPDCDQPGVGHMREIAADLAAHGIPIAGWLLAPPNAPWSELPAKGGLDVADWIDQGATAKQIWAAVQQDPPGERTVESKTDQDVDLAAEVAELRRLDKGSNLALLPEVLETPLKRLADRMNLPVEAYYWALLCVAASQVASRTRLELDRSTDYKVPPILWGGIVGETGSRKTPILNAIVSPLEAIQAELEQLHQERLKQYQSELSQYEASKKANKQATLPDPPEAPKPIDLYLCDFTLEALAVAVANHPEKGLLVNQDELTTFFKSMDAYRNGRGSDRARWLEFYHGRALKVDRKTTGRLYAQQTAISLIGGIQPSVIGSLWESDKTGEDGLWARFAWVRIPITTSDGIQTGPSYDLGELLKALYCKLQAMPARAYRLDRDGVQLWNRWHAEVDQQILHEPSDILRAALPKTKDRAARIALVIHLIEAAAGNFSPADIIPAATLAKAINFARWLQGQTRLLYGELGVADNPEAAKILRFVNRFKGIEVTPRMVRNWWSGQKKPQKAECLAFMKRVCDLGLGEFDDQKSVLHVKFQSISPEVPQSLTSQEFQPGLKSSPELVHLVHESSSPGEERTKPGLNGLNMDYDLVQAEAQSEQGIQPFWTNGLENRIDDEWEVIAE